MGAVINRNKCLLFVYSIEPWQEGIWAALIICSQTHHRRLFTLRKSESIRQPKKMIYDFRKLLLFEVLHDKSCFAKNVSAARLLLGSWRICVHANEDILSLKVLDVKAPNFPFPWLFMVNQQSLSKYRMALCDKPFIYPHMGDWTWVPCPSGNAFNKEQGRPPLYECHLPLVLLGSKKDIFLSHFGPYVPKDIQMMGYYLFSGQNNKYRQIYIFFFQFARRR